MAEVTAKLVGELRKMTSAGLMDCKKALVETDGDVEAAAEAPAPEAAAAEAPAGDAPETPAEPAKA